MNSKSAQGKRPKNWLEFLTEAAKQMSGPKALRKYVLKMAYGGDYLTACEIVRNRLGNQAFSDLCRSEFLAPGFSPARIHELIHLLDSRIVLTPNVDTIYETYVSSKQRSPAIVKTYRDADLAEAIRLPGRVILKIHGTIATPHQMIFTRSSYAAARNEFPASYAVISALILTSTFLFIGCGLTDPDTTLLLEDYAFTYAVGRTHYMAITKPEAGRTERQQVIEKTRQLSLLTYDPANGHKALEDSLQDLVQKVGDARQVLLTSQNW